MTQECSMVWNSIMTYLWKQGHLEMFNQKCFSRRTKILSHLSKDGHFQEKYTSMVMNACYHHQILIPTYPTLPTRTWLPFLHCFLLCFCFYLFCFNHFSSLWITKNFWSHATIACRCNACHEHVLLHHREFEHVGSWQAVLICRELCECQCNVPGMLEIS